MINLTKKIATLAALSVLIGCAHTDSAPVADPSPTTAPTAEPQEMGGATVVLSWSATYVRIKSGLFKRVVTWHAESVHENGCWVYGTTPPVCPTEPPTFNAPTLQQALAKWLRTQKELQ